MVLVSAPAGYGKSTLVAQWSDLDSRASAWVQLGSGDNDSVVLLAHVVAALERTGHVSGELLEELSGRMPRIDEVAIPLLAADLGERDPFVLVLDDVDVITAEKSRAILAFLVDQVPSGSQLVLVTRGDPGVALGRLRASGALVEVGTALLALDPMETRDVAASRGLELSQAEAGALCERTEGWAAAVALATLALRGRDDAAVRAAGLSGDQQQIADYLLEEVLERQPDHLERFLLGTSILDRMTAPLCDAVLRTDDAAGSLEGLARSNAFVVSLDDHREWYRYHHLFRDLLRAELKRRHPELYTVYLRRAAAWCERHDSPAEAFAYAHEAGDLARAGRIALASRDEFASRGQIESLRLWLERCTDPEIESDPQLSIAAAWVFGYLGDAARARRFLVAAEWAPVDVASADGGSSLRSALASLRSAMAPDGIPQMLRDAELGYACEQKMGYTVYLRRAAGWCASGTAGLARRSRTRMRPAISLTPAESRLRIGTSLPAAARSTACGSGSSAAPTRRSSQTRSCRSRPRGCSGISATRRGRGDSWLPPSGLRSTRPPPTRHPRFARHSRASEAPWHRTASHRCCEMLSSATRVRRPWAPMASRRPPRDGCGVPAPGPT